MKNKLCTRATHTATLFWNKWTQFEKEIRKK